ncbi:hypothetical protein AM500_12155 [Bacillus sp. FJAT-18017]|uniref:hypothetical protein n=1 Tax=Bacillus sp. FJAT-18017 TaxID=1705566 RepID=UPI0006AFC697|nr:hypothetical protein [Bacillus sp. FJAT-18017]ALC90454.1 hypothetical protein AM500_12155 [Bacillus sp. FJAT-18017]
MLLWYVALLFIAFILGYFDVSVLVSFLVVAAYIVLTFPLVMPLFWSKNTNRMMNYLKKSHNAYYRFLYRFLNGEQEEAEKIVGDMRKGKIKTLAKVMLLIKQEHYSEARKLLETIRNGSFKDYYLAAAAHGEGKIEDYHTYKDKVKDADFKKWLEIEELVRTGNKEEAQELLDEQISTLRGMKLLSAIHYRQEMENR